MWSCPNCGSWIFASRICPNCGAWVGDDSADEQDSDHPVELAIMGHAAELLWQGGKGRGACRREGARRIQLL